ncbi:MAG TPA: SAM-dependent methyltransferase [Coxiellaceae bacterium]|nr:SAM-dependent methyltransferase [Coxiellaceae bacterium]
MIECRTCGGSSEEIISFGNMPIANGFLKQKDFLKEYFFDLAVSFCPTCKMFQLIEQPDPKMMFHENYAFFSSTSKAMAEHFKKMANDYLNNFIQNRNEAFVVELGSNDGIMLKHFASFGIKHLGIEPSSNVAEVARQNGVNTICDFFSEETARKVEAEYGSADIISAANVMCHIPDLASVGKGVAILLKEKGIFVFEDPYLGDVIQKTSYDQIYDEHVYIFSVQSVANAFAPYGLEVFHVEPQVTHGGSMRYYLCCKGAYTIRDSVKKQLEFEDSLGLDKIETYKNFAQNCEKNKNDFITLLKQLKEDGKRVIGYAATSKSTTVLNYSGIGQDLIEYICDTTPLKRGKFSPGMHIPIKPYENFKKDKPDYAILFAWNHAQEIFTKEKDFIAQGGKWIVFVPSVKILSPNESVA